MTTARRPLGTGPDREHQDHDHWPQGPRFLPVELAIEHEHQEHDADTTAQPVRHGRRPLTYRGE